MTLLLLEHDANVEATSKDNRTPLHFACACGHKEIARILLDKGAQLEARADVREKLYFAVSTHTHMCRYVDTL